MKHITTSQKAQTNIQRIKQYKSQAHNNIKLQEQTNTQKATCKQKQQRREKNNTLS